MGCPRRGDQRRGRGALADQAGQDEALQDRGGRRALFERLQMQAAAQGQFHGFLPCAGRAALDWLVGVGAKTKGMSGR